MAAKAPARRIGKYAAAWLGCAALCAALLPAQVAAQSSTTSATFDVTASIALGCWIYGIGQSATLGNVASLDFGTVPARIAASVDANTLSSQSFTMRCTPGTNVTMQTNEGRNAVGTTRRLRMGTTENYIEYRLCRDPSCVSAMSRNDSFLITVLPTTGDIKFDFYAKANVLANLPAGVYTDDVTVTLTW
jgi:spore coat protein U-like protein